MTDLCDWNPAKDCPAAEWTRNGKQIRVGCASPATVIVDCPGEWHLCESCAALPRFERFGVRRPDPSSAAKP